MIFVFGSNLKGIHGAGAAKYAYDNCGASWGQGQGLQGNSYAIPTCSAPGIPLSLEEIKKNVDTFLKDAHLAQIQKSSMQFQVTRIACGFAGYTDHQIAPMFRPATDNVWLPARWSNILFMEGYTEGYEAAVKTAQAMRREDFKLRKGN